MTFMNRPCTRVWLAFAALALANCFPAPAQAQVKSAAERLHDLEKRFEDLEKRNKKQAKELEQVKAALGEKKKSDEKGFFSDGILTIGGGVKLKLGGKAEILLVDSQSERDPIVGNTANPDPRLELNRLRLSPLLLVNKEISLLSQIDFKPDAGRTLLKELVVRYKVDPNWWFRSEARLGLDDRFIRPTRGTKNYPLLGNAFWRDESIALSWMLRFGDKDGRPEGRARGESLKNASRDGQDVVLEDSDGQPIEIAEDGGIIGAQTHRSPFDFANNLGELRTYFSIGNGNSLDSNEVGFDGASFNDLVQDDRNVTDDLSIREVGLGLGYARSFEWLGDLDLLGFYYNDELSDRSLDFLSNDLTIRNPVTGAPIAGYGDSGSTASYKYGVGGEYFLPSARFLPPQWKARAGDGLRVGGQYIRAHDGKLIRDGWYVQTAYRHSFKKGLLADKYLRSVEPIVRYGVLETNLEPSALLPGTWDRRQLLVGVNIDMYKNILIVRCEYAFNAERTGGGGSSVGPSSVTNNELLVEVLLQF